MNDSNEVDNDENNTLSNNVLLFCFETPILPRLLWDYSYKFINNLIVV